MYKDKNKQREAQRDWVRQKRATKGSTEQGSTPQMPDVEIATIHPNGDVDYKVTPPKRGKDIKCFEDLPPDVQQTIDNLSVVDGKIDQTIKANRTAIAVNYQHLFPDRYYSTSAGGVACGCEATERKGAIC